MAAEQLHCSFLLALLLAQNLHFRRGAIYFEVDAGHVVVQLLHLALQLENIAFELLHSIQTTDHALSQLIVEVFVLSF